MSGSPIRTLDILCPDAPVEIRVLSADGVTTAIRRFTNHERAVKWIQQFPTAKGIYVVMNPFDALAIKRTGVDDNAVTRRSWILIDLDVIRDAGTNSTDAELAKAQAMAIPVREYLDAMGWPRPVEAMSGNGVSLLVPVDLPNDAKTLNAVVGFLRHLSANFSDKHVKVDTSVANASRITKLYGTQTRKGPHTAERPQRLSALTFVPDPLQRLPEADFWHWAGLWADDSPGDSQTPVEHNLDRETRIEIARSWLAGQAPAIEGQGGEPHTFYICCVVAVGHDLTSDDALHALQDWNARCLPPWSASGLRKKIRNADLYAGGVRGARLVRPSRTPFIPGYDPRILRQLGAFRL